MFRQFYAYDDHTSLVKIIKDNGCSPDKEDLNGVTERLITYLFPRKEIPVGLPERIDEMYLDPVTGQETLLKRMICFYSPQGKLIRQDHYDNCGVYRYSLSWEWDAHGNLVREVNALAQEIVKQYDENDNLIFEQGPSSTFYTLHHYDFSNRRIRTEEIHPTENKHFITTYRYDYVGNKVAVIDRFGQETRFVYDDLNRLVQTVHPIVLNENGYPIQPIEAIQYDVCNNPIAVTDAKGQTTHTRYNARGKPTWIQQADGTAEAFLYDLDGSLVRYVDATGTYTSYQRDSLGRLLSEEVYSSHSQLLSRKSYTYQGLRLIASTDAEGHSTNYHYDGAGRLILETCADKQKAYAYDSLGRIEKELEWFGDHQDDVAIKAYAYDLLNRLVEERTEDAFGNILTATSYAYDALSNRTEIKQALEAGTSVTRIEYSTEGPIRLFDPEGNLTKITYHPHLNALNQHVLQITLCDPYGTQTIKTQDALGRVVNIIQKNAFGILLTRQDLFYDANGNLARCIHSTLLNGQIIKQTLNLWLYNAANKEIALMEAVGTPEQKNRTITYNQYGQKEKIIKPDGVEILHTYDDLGRLRLVLSTDQTIAYGFDYNLNNQLVKAWDLNQQTATSRVLNETGLPLIETLANGLTLQYSYDRMGRTKQVILPDGTAIQYEHGPAFLKKVHRIVNGQRTYSHHYQHYDQAGHLLQEQLIKQLGTIQRSYDTSGRTKQIVAQHWSQQEGSYDKVGRLLSFQTQDAIGKISYQLTYDDLHQLIGETGDQTHTYLVDSLANRLAKDTTLYQVNHLNQVIQEGDTEYQYDRNGNLIFKKKGQESTTYRYDAWDRLIAVTCNDDTTEYHYDAFHRRIRKIQQNNEWKYLYQGQNEIGTISPNGEIIEFRMLGVGVEADIGAAVALELKGKVFAPLPDNQGNIVSLIDSLTGQAQEIYRYTAFGEERIFDAQGQELKESCNPWRYRSKRSDPETGLIYFGRRYLDPQLGRWITTDPLGFSEGPNLYAYLYTITPLPFMTPMAFPVKPTLIATP